MQRSWSHRLNELCGATAVVFKSGLQESASFVFVSNDRHQQTNRGRERGEGKPRGSHEADRENERSNGDGRVRFRGTGAGWTQQQRNYDGPRKVSGGREFTSGGTRVSRLRPGFEEHRYWCFAEKEPPPHSEKFVLLSYNILADKNAIHHRDRLYSHIPWRVMDWNRRKTKLVRELALWSPDIMCLQEVDTYEEMREELQKRGYCGTYKGRTGSACDGCAIFWKTSKFRLLQEESIQFNELGLRDNVAQLAVFQATDGNDSPRMSNSAADQFPSSGHAEVSGSLVIVGNIHVLFNPRRGDIKLGQVRVLLESAHVLSEKWGGAPVTIAGDFNSTPGSDLYRFVSTSELDISALNKTTISGQLTNGEGPLSVMSKVGDWAFLNSKDWGDSVELRNIQAGPLADMGAHTYMSSSQVGGVNYRCDPPESTDAFRSQSSEEDVPENSVQNWSWTEEELRLATGSPDCTVMDHSLHLRSAYPQVEGELGCRDPQGEPCVTTFHRKFMGTVDYIWHTEGIAAVRVLDTLPVSVLQRSRGLPSWKWGSDHLAIACEFAFLTSLPEESK